MRYAKEGSLWKAKRCFGTLRNRLSDNIARENFHEAAIIEGCRYRSLALFADDQSQRSTNTSARKTVHLTLECDI